MPMKNPTLDAFFPRGIRNFNPGNIENGPFARSQPGYVGSDGRFAQFDTMDHGIDAQSSLLQGYGNKGLNTPNAIINRYAPSSDGNNTNAYASFVSKKMGVDPNQPLDMNDPNVRRNMAMAMGRFENGMSPVDPRSWQASASPQQATGAPMQLPGATPEQPPGAQSMSLGDQENQQPFNNIGSTLANMGASIASLDNRGTGIASLNASRVAQNLTAQENAREAQGGWKYAGQTQNGQGLMFQNSRGEIRVEPLNSQFAGQKDPESLRVLDALASDPQRLETYQKMHGTGGKEPMDDATSKFWANMVLEDPASISKVPQANRPQVMKDFVQSAKDAGYSEKDVVQRSNDIKGNIVEDRKRSQIIAQVGSARPEFESAATNFVRSAEKVNNKFGNIPLDTLYNKTLTTLDPSSEEAVAINNMKVAQEGLTKGFVRAMSGSAAGNAHAEERMTKIFDPAQPLNMVKGGIGVLVRDVKNYDESARFARDNARARNAGKTVPHPELEDENAVLERILGTNNQLKSNNSSTPKAGDVIDGFRFKGGDPSKQENWEKS